LAVWQKADFNFLFHLQQKLELEKMSPKAFDMIDTYIAGVYEGTKATAAKWDGIERRSKERRSEAEEDLGFKNRRNGTDE
jgi:hypothetical protein